MKKFRDGRWNIKLYYDFIHVFKEISAVTYVRNSILNDKQFDFVNVNYNFLVWTSVFMEE